MLKYLPYIDNRRGRFIYKGWPAQQNHRIFDYFPSFFEEEKFDIVIEIGTSEGGLSLYIHELSQNYNFDFWTYDTEMMLNDLPPFDFRKKSAWDGEGYNEIITALDESDKKALLLVDGGNKILEFNLYAPFLKKGDYIMTHDYAPDKNFHEKYMKYGIWEWCQITEKDLNLEVYGLSKNHHSDDFLNVAWGCFVKTEI